MATVNLRIYEGFDRENHWGCNFASSVIIHGQMPYNFLLCHPRKIKIPSNKIVNICNQTKIRVLNVNIVSEISYDAK